MSKLANSEKNALRRNGLRVIGPFALILLAMVLLSAYSIDILSAARAWVNGESLWSKAQKNAVIHLMLYANNHQESEFAAYQKSLDVIEGDRAARDELERTSNPDMSIVTAGLLKGGNNLADIPGIVRLFTNFRHVPSLDKAITAWKTADGEIARLNQLAQQIHEDVINGRATDATLVPTLERIQESNARSTALTLVFTDAVSEISRQMRDLLIMLQALAAVFLMIPAVMMVMRDVRREREQTLRLAHQASHDALTGLHNRAEFERRLEEALNQVKAEGAQHAVMYLDLDQFKVVNDTCGHAVGDTLLREMASLMRDRLRYSDTLARLGGDEFGILLYHCSLESGEQLAQEIREAVSQYRFVWQQRPFALGVSVGLIGLDKNVREVSDALSAADAACYLAKQKGRNRVQVYQKHDEAIRLFHAEMEWVSRVHEALDQNRFCLYAQEILPLLPNTPGKHIEVLLRMYDEEGRITPPSEFIPACERYNLMPTLDRWVIDAAFQELSRRPLGEIAMCAINLSAASLDDLSLPEFIQARARHYGVPMQQLCFEITETAAVGNLEQAAAFIRQMQKAGCSFALDDFGAGMTSFAYLKHLPAEFIKIDGAFIREMFDRPINLSIIEAIQRIAHTTGQRTIAEWVDSEAKLDRLREMGVEYAQGYAVSMPAPFTAQNVAVSVSEKEQRTA